MYYVTMKVETMWPDKIITLDGFGDVLDFAESLGWIDTHGDATEDTWSPSEADACEGDALDFIESKGYEINFNDDDE